MAERTEISFEVSADEVSVLDGYCQAKGIKRTAVLRQLLRKWSNEKHLEAEMIIRVAGRVEASHKGVAGSKPEGSGSNRDDQS